MGALNVTLDSFVDGGHFFQRDKAVEHGFALARDGAEILDVGGESIRPYSKKISTDKEIDRVISVIQALSRELIVPISIDTYKAKAARAALKAGASIINDISALRFSPDMISIAAEAGVPVILMHMKEDPANMQDSPAYNNLIPEILGFLKMPLIAR
jgi:dihydropteroate synthase